MQELLQSLPARLALAVQQGRVDSTSLEGLVESYRR